MEILVITIAGGPITEGAHMTRIYLDRNHTARKTGVLCAMTCLLTALAVGAPAVGLSPASGPPTTNVIVSGSGYAPGMLIDIYFGATDEVLAVSSASGEFAIALHVPAVAQPGIHWVTAAARRTGIAAQEAFLVQTNWPEIGFTAKGNRSNSYENTLDRKSVVK